MNNWKRTYVRQVILPLALTTSVLLTIGTAGRNAQARTTEANDCAAIEWEIDGCELDRREALEIYCITESEYEFLRRTTVIVTKAPRANGCVWNRSASAKRRSAGAERPNSGNASARKPSDGAERPSDGSASEREYPGMAPAPPPAIIAFRAAQFAASILIIRKG